jgi:hypothetical protein
MAIQNPIPHHKKKERGIPQKMAGQFLKIDWKPYCGEG